MAPDCGPPTEPGRRRGVAVSSPEIRSKGCQDDNILLDLQSKRHKLVACQELCAHLWKGDLDRSLLPSLLPPEARLLASSASRLALFTFFLRLTTRFFFFSFFPFSFSSFSSSSSRLENSSSCSCSTSSSSVVVERFSSGGFSTFAVEASSSLSSALNLYTTKFLSRPPYLTV